MKTKSAKPFTHISLFSGAGGLDIGLELAGFETIAAVEFNHYACETLRKNQELGCIPKQDFPMWFEKNILEDSSYARMSEHEISSLRSRLRSAAGTAKYLSSAKIFETDIRTVESKSLFACLPKKNQEVDLVSGGPPCQPFSRAGKRKTLDDDRGTLFAEFVRIVDEVRPKAFLFENVKGLVQSKTDIWYAKCKLCGENTFPRFNSDRTPPEINTPVPQCIHCKSSKTEWVIQEQVAGGSAQIIQSEFKRLGYDCHAVLLEAADYGVPQYRQRWIMVGFRSPVDFTFPDKLFVSAADTDLFSLNKPQHRTLADAILSNGDNYHDVTPNSKSAVLWVKNVVRPHAEPVTWTTRRPSPTIGAHQGAKLAIAPNGVPEEQLYRQQWHTLGRRQGDTLPVPVEHKSLTDHDLLRLQTFPEDWFVYGTRMERAFQIGNAVPPKLAEVIGKSILRMLPAIPVKSFGKER